MLAAERQAKIVELVKDRGSVLVEELAMELQVSPMTIRRDLEKLHQENVIERCHGGAVVKQEISYSDKKVHNRPVKEAIAHQCFEFVNEGDVVFLDAGTTTYEIAVDLLKFKNLTVVTNDLQIANILQKSEFNLMICGGSVQKETGSTTGAFAIQMLQRFRFDVGFFGATSINDMLEIMNPTVDKAFFKQSALERCDRAYLAVDASKFNRQAMSKVNDISDYTAIVTDYHFSERMKKKIMENGGAIISVEV